MERVLAPKKVVENLHRIPMKRPSLGESWQKRASDGQGAVSGDSARAACDSAAVAGAGREQHSRYRRMYGDGMGAAAPVNMCRGADEYRLTALSFGRPVP